MKAKRLRKGLLAFALSVGLLLESVSGVTVVNAQEVAAEASDTEATEEQTEVEADAGQPVAPDNQETTEEEQSGTTEGENPNQTEQEEAGDEQSQETEGEDSNQAEQDETENGQSEETEDEDPNQPEQDETENGQSEEADSEESAASEDVSPKDDVKALSEYSMPDGYVLSEEEVELKKSLSAHIHDLDDKQPGIDYVDREFIVLAETVEEAQLIADAYGITLKNYDTGVATFRVSEEDTMERVLSVGACMENNLPSIWPNDIQRIFEEEPTETDETQEEGQTSESETEENKKITETEDGLIIEEEIISDVEASESELTRFNDPFLNSDSEMYQWQHGIVGSYAAWQCGYMGAGIKVAVLDSGVYAGHQDLPTVTALGCHSEDLTGVSESHGSHVAGIIAAKANNGLGGSGVAPSVSLYSGCVLPGGSGSAAAIIAGINKAVNAGVDIINMSLGGIVYNGVYEAAVRNAYERGVAVIVSAGNDGGQTYNYPAAYDGAIAVAATNQNGTRAYFSTYNNKVQFSAPGIDIWSTGNSGSSYENMSGTSQACPVVSGCAAVLLASEPSLKEMPKSPERVNKLVEKLKKSASRVNGSGMGAGIPQLNKALNIKTATEKPLAPAIETELVGENLRLVMTAQKGTEIYYRTDGYTPVMKDGIWNGGVYRYSGPVTVYAYSGSKCVKAVAVNAAGLVSPVKSVTYKLSQTACSIELTGINYIAKGKSAQMTATVTPATVANKKVSWSLHKVGNSTPMTAEEQKSSGVAISQKGIVTVGKNAVAGSEYYVRVTAQNGSNALAMKNFIVIDNVRISSAKFKSSKATMLVGESGTPYELDAATVSKTPAGVTEFCWYSSNKTVATVSANGIIQAIKPGQTVITALANDGSGKKATLTLTVKQPVTKIIRGETFTVAAGKSVQITYYVQPYNASNKALSWSIEKATGLRINANGKVTTTANTPAGKYTVTAEAKDGSGVKTTCTVKVTAGGISKIDVAEKKDKSIVLFRTSGGGYAPTTKRVKLNVEGINQDCMEAYCTKPGIATASLEQSSGTYYVNISATKVTGSATVVVTSNDGTNKSLKINVKVYNPASNLSISLPAGRSEYVGIGKNIQLSTVFEQEYGAVQSKAVNWTITKGAAYAKVSQSGKVTISKTAAVGQQITVVATAKDGSGVSGSRTLVAVKPTNMIAVVSEGKFVKSGTGLRCLADMNEPRAIPVYTDGSFGGNVFVSSSNPSVVSVMNYRGYLFVYAKKKGTAAVTLTSIDGCKSVKYSIRVE